VSVSSELVMLQQGVPVVRGPTKYAILYNTIRQRIRIRILLGTDPDSAKDTGITLRPNNGSSEAYVTFNSKLL
jgi:hypothetical protein